MIRFLLIRHALTNSVGKRLSGRTPGLSLNTEGQQQAQNLAQRLEKVNIDVIYSSPLERAMETAKPLALVKQLQVNISNDFLEIDFGKWTNCNIEDLKSDTEFIHFNTFRSFTRIPEGEMMAEAQLRIIKGLENLRVKFDSKTVAVVSHADLIKSAIAFYAGIHLDMFHRVEISPASVSIIELYENFARITLLNDTGTL